MSIPELVRRPESWHPGWCSPKHCRAAEQAHSYHRGAPVRADLTQSSDVTITAQVLAWSCQPPGETTAFVELVLERTGCHSREGYQLEPDAYRALLAVLTNSSIAGPMRAEFDRAVAEYQRDRPEAPMLLGPLAGER